jgi:hypothetical protein
MPRRHDALRARKLRRNSGLQRRSWIVAVDDIGPQAPQFSGEAKKGLREWCFSQNSDCNAFSDKCLAQSAEVAVSDDGDIVSMRSLQTAELCHQDLGPTHLKTVDNVNDLHVWSMQAALSGRFCGLDRRLESNVHESVLRGNSSKVANDILVRSVILNQAQRSRRACPELAEGICGPKHMSHLESQEREAGSFNA